jgi:hypothetical protein
MEEMIEANLASIETLFNLLQQIPDSIGSDSDKEIARAECLRGLYGAFANLGIVPEADAEEIGKIVDIIAALPGVSAIVG